MLLSLLLAAPAYATDVLIPEATPRDLADFAVAFMFYEMVVAAGRDAGLELEDAEAIRRWAGTAADGCYDAEGCPANLWERTDARLAVVMTVGSSPGGLEVDVRLHGADDPAAFKVIRQVVPAGREAELAATIARTAQDALPLLPSRPPPPAAIVLEDDIVRRVPPPPDLPQEELTARSSGQGKGTVPTEPEITRDPDPPPPPPDLPSRPLAQDEERRAMGIPAGAYDKYRQSGLPRDAWVAKARVRSGRAHLELGGGLGLGDVDRGYGVRVRLQESSEDAFTTAATSTWEGAGTGTGPGGWFAVGYAPTWFLETSVAAGAQWGRKHLDTGWECPAEACETPSSEVEHDPVMAVQAVIEPRARLFAIPTGIVKPYALLAFTLRLHDGVVVTDLDSVEYEDAPAGASWGPTGGVGVMIDASSPVSLFLEAPATWLVSPSGRLVEGSGVTQSPGQLEATGLYVRVAGGLVVRL